MTSSHSAGSWSPAGLARDQRIESSALVWREARDEVLDEGPASAVGNGTERADQHESRNAFRMRDGHVHREVAAPVVADEPGTIPLEEVEQGDLVRDVGLDVAWPAREAGLHAALLRKDAFDGVDELIEQAEDRLCAETGPPVEEDRPRP